MDNFRSSEVLNVSVFTAISTFVRLVTAFVSAKVIAIYLGPEGLGLLGQLSGFVSIVLVLSTGATTNGVIKYLAEYNGEANKQESIIKSSLIITIISSLLIGTILVFFSGYWSNLLFGSHTNYSSIILIFGFTLIFYAGSSLFVAILNGLKEYKKYNYINIWSSLAGLLISIIFITYLGLYGALLAAVTSQLAIFIIFLYYFSRVKTLNWRKIINASINKFEYYKLAKFSLMAIITSASVPVSQIFIRNYILDNADAASMGYYEGINRISLLYLSLITTTLSVYYLPKLSEIKNVQLLRREILNGYKLLLPITLLILLTVYLLRNILIRIVFTSSFEPITAYFLPQLVGDFFKIASWLLAFQMLAKAMTVTFIITEIFFSATLVMLSVYFIQMYGGVGAVYAYGINYFLYFICMIIVFRKLLMNKQI